MAVKKKKVVKRKVKKVKTAARKEVKKSGKSESVNKTNKITAKFKKVAAKRKTESARNARTQTRYSDKELQEFKQLIMEKLEASRKELKYLHEQINRTAELGSDDSDTKFSGLEDGTGTSEREYLSQMASRQIQYIDHLEKALVRIANKTYGICRVTGKLISKERLRAVPHATLSIEAKKAQSAGV
ncbi:MAG TPA: TraR/DksA C4-type zinc finger protein [Chitinophagales bacterium]|nr:TraR/DksA C4-type zinc finger protein [Chitinophagales bacterium]